MENNRTSGKSVDVHKRIDKFLTTLRVKHVRLHKKYEELFWVSYMGDHTVDTKKNIAQKVLDKFRADESQKEKIDILLREVKDKKQKESLQYWQSFFTIYQVPREVLKLREKISLLEDTMLRKVARRKEGYIHPQTKKFIYASYLKMSTMIRTHEDETIRKACFDATESLAHTNLTDYVLYVRLLNEYAREMGHEDFYSFKLMQEEGMTKKELFTLFDTLHEKTKYAFMDVRIIEKTMKGLRKPWNYSYMLSGDFTKEEDQYFPFEKALLRWGRSFTALGISYKGGTLQLDLLDRKGKYANGFCHWPTLVHYKNGSRISGKSNFTCTVVPDEPGSSALGYNTLFHEGGHAAHLLNVTNEDTCLNHEYPPMSTAWAETQSMFLDTLFSSYEWKSKYAKNVSGEVYPFELFKRKVEKLNILSPLSLNSIIMIASFERAIYETKELNQDIVLALARKYFKKYTDLSGDSFRILNVPHIYSWTSACAYHGYGLAELALHQWRHYFKKKYGSIVDNPNVGKEMEKVWRLGSQKTFKELVKVATGMNLSSAGWIREHTRSTKQVLTQAKKDSQALTTQRRAKKVKLNAIICMVHGKQTISTNKNSFEDMVQKYAIWLCSQKSTTTKLK